MLAGEVVLYHVLVDVYGLVSWLFVRFEHRLLLDSSIGSFLQYQYAIVIRIILPIPHLVHVVSSTFVLGEE